MRKDDFGCLDGFRIVKLNKGWVYELPRRMAAKLINKQSARLSYSVEPVDEVYK